MDERSPESAQIVMIIFVISHSKADCERGFLINPNVTDGNMKKQSIRRKRLIRDHMQKQNLRPATIEVTNVLKKSCRAAYQLFRTKNKRMQQKRQVGQAKQMLDQEVTAVEDKIDHFMDNSKMQGKNFVQLLKDAEIKVFSH